jgi:hypothetical protein
MGYSKQKQKECKKIIDMVRNYTEQSKYTKHNMIHFGEHPQNSEYIVTGIQAGNIRGELGWHKYIGYVVQVRKGVGAFGSDLILIRHPNGELNSHENQMYYRINEELKSKTKALFYKKIGPEKEDYSQPYTIAGKYPAIGKIIESDVPHPIPDNSPLAKITTICSDGSKTITIC